jgi:hypothetical protein
MTSFGWIGSFLLACCGAPEAYLAWKRRRSDLSWIFLAMWGVGELCVLIPVLFEIKVGFLLLNYIANVIFISVICYYKYKGEQFVNKKERGL